MAKEDPITAKQIDYIEALIEQRGTNVQCALGGCFEKPPMHLADLNRGQASEMISWLKDEDWEEEEPNQAPAGSSIDDDDVPF